MWNWNSNEWGVFLSAAGQSIELSGLLWIGWEIRRAVGRARADLAKATRIEVLAHEMEQSGAPAEEVRAWKRAQLSEHRLKDGTWFILENLPTFVQISIADSLKWKYGAATVAIGLAIAVLGGWLQIG